MGHQLKTPLSNLKMYTEFLRNDEITPEQKQGGYVSVKPGQEGKRFMVVLVK